MIEKRKNSYLETKRWKEEAIQFMKKICDKLYELNAHYWTLPFEIYWTIRKNGTEQWRGIKIARDVPTEIKENQTVVRLIDEKTLEITTSKGCRRLTREEGIDELLSSIHKEVGD